jgi:dihydroflavonol-4-reductase
MKPTLVTGANGHLGYNVCRLLAARGEQVRAMVRKSADTAPLARLGVEIVHGDILDPGSTNAAAAGAGRVYHTAAGFLMWATDPEQAIVRPSVDGTRNVMNAAAKAGVEKVLYVSTSGTIGFSRTPDRLLDEKDKNENPHTAYFQGKIAAEVEAFAAGKRDKLPISTINPGFILGPRFWKPSESTRQIVDALELGVTVYFEGGFGVVDVEDVAQGAILAMEKGKDGERYLVSGENVTVRQMMQHVADLAGLGPPRLRAPVPVLRVVAGALERVAKVTGKRPLVDRAQIEEFAGTYSYYDVTKAKRELGYTYRDARETVRRTVAWTIDKGFVKSSRARRLRPDPSLAGAYGGE